MHDYVKAVHDQGVLAGVSAHNPDNIKRIAEIKGLPTSQMALAVLGNAKRLFGGE